MGLDLCDKICKPQKQHHQATSGAGEKGISRRVSKIPIPSSAQTSGTPVTFQGNTAMTFPMTRQWAMEASTWYTKKKKVKRKLCFCPNLETTVLKVSPTPPGTSMIYNKRPKDRTPEASPTKLPCHITLRWTWNLSLGMQASLKDVKLLSTSQNPLSHVSEG